MQSLYPYAPLLLALSTVIILATVGAVITLVLLARRDLRRALNTINLTRAETRQVGINTSKITEIDNRLHLVEKDTHAIKHSRDEFAAAAKGIQQVRIALEALPSWIYTMKMCGEDEAEKKIS